MFIVPDPRISEYLMAEDEDTEWLKEYFINISPFSKKK